ncbi:MAG: S8 family serine peptidase [Marinilabiliaceae bacterium]|nr:S8 family serine peptidase [Marinilabiliaceae bacterium]
MNKYFLVLLFFVCLQGYSQKFSGRMRLRSHEKENYLATKDPDIITILQKYDVVMYQSFPDETEPQALLYYTLIGVGKEIKENSIRDLFATGKFYEWFDETWAGDLILKPHEDVNYVATKDPEIIAILEEHDVELYQVWAGPREVLNRDLLLIYLLKGTGIVNKENSLKDLFATGKFEEWIPESGIGIPLACANPVFVNDPDFLNPDYGWPLDMIQVPCAWSITTGNPWGMYIGIADSDFESTHEDLQYKFALLTGPVSAGYPHGTWVSSIAGADTNNGLGIAGVGYNTKIAAWRIFHDVVGDATPSNIRSAIMGLYNYYWAPVINVSWSTTGLTYAEAVTITQSGVTLVLSGGNTTYSQNHSLIADIPGVIVVSGVDEYNYHAGGQARNQWIDICAPGIGIRMANENNSYRVSGGTSFAAAFVSGTIALMLSANPSLTPSQIESIIKATADPIEDGHLYPGQLGAGRLNAYKAVRAAICVNSFTNQTVTTDKSVFGCDNLNVENVTVTNGAKLTLEAPGSITINGPFSVSAGSKFSANSVD